MSTLVARALFVFLFRHETLYFSLWILLSARAHRPRIRMNYDLNSANFWLVLVEYFRIDQANTIAGSISGDPVAY